MFIHPIIMPGLGIKDQTPYNKRAGIISSRKQQPKSSISLIIKKTSPNVFPLNFLVARQHLLLFRLFFPLNFNLARSRFLIIFYQIKQSLKVMSRKSFLPSKPNRQKTKLVTRKTSPAHMGDHETCERKTGRSLHFDNSIDT